MTSSSHQAHAVLPAVSRGYPPRLDGFPTCSSPVRHGRPPKRLPFDLHALGTPPALFLSQDQTLHQVPHYGDVYLVMQPNRHSSRCREPRQTELRESSTLYELRFSCQGAGGETKPARTAGGNTSSRFRVSVTWCPLLPLSRGFSNEPLSAQESLNSIFILHIPCQLQGPPITLIGRSVSTGRPQPTRGNTTHPSSGCQGQFWDCLVIRRANSATVP